jgi:glycosyltransferase involved in cell wall biosynthesis
LITGVLKLIFLNRFFYPDLSATSQLLSDLTFALAEWRYNVVVITSRQLYDAPAELLPSKEICHAVAIYRVWTSRFGRVSLLGRAVDYATFYLSSAWHLWRLATAGDIVIAKTDPPMLSVIAAPVCWLRGARLVNWLQDMFPETAEVLGTGGRLARIPYSAMRWLRTKSLKVARMNVVLGERMAACVAALGISRERVAIINNWADNTVITSIDHSANRLRAEWGVNGKFVVGYSGNLGRAHDLDTVLEAIAVIEDAAKAASTSHSMGESAISAIAWLFIGGGARFVTLKAEAARCNFTSVTFKPYQSQARLAESLSASDVHLVSLRPELEGLIVPSKFYGIAAAGRPTIFIGDKGGEVARLIERYECGRTVATGDGVGLARAILDLAKQPALCRRMGERARRASEGDLDRLIAIARWEAVLTDASGGTPKCCDTVFAKDRDRR